MTSPQTELRTHPPRHAAPRASGGTPAAPRTDVQALRAIAVGAVVLNHLWPNRLPGGYVGVDVFFVISGFLITSHLLKELLSTGRVRLATFYARRVRRLLPAALLVLAVSAVAVWAFLPYTAWSRSAQEIAASAFYVENWALAARSVNYSALNDDATVAQHYWSLSVEEQFYLLWPLLLLGLYLLAVRGARGASRPRRVVATGVLVVGALSLVLSIVMTTRSPSEAYFVTPVRFWEFALGGLLALGATRVRLNGAAANVLALVGFATIAATALVYDHATPFPGWLAAVPALGTAAVILAGTERRPLLHDRVTALRPVQVLGDVSYSVYLWHWPLIVVAPFALSRSLTTVDKLGIAVASVALAWVTKVLVEDKGRTWRWASVRPRRSFVLMLAGMAIIGALALGLHAAAGRSAAEAERAAQEAAAADAACYGPAALAPGAPCDDPFGPAANPVLGEDSKYYVLDHPDACGQAGSWLEIDGTKTTVRCDFGGGPDAPRVWVMGDSHAQQWQAPLLEIADERGWQVTLSFLGACPPADVEYVGYRGNPATAEKRAQCDEWRDAVHDEISAEKPAMVFTSSFARAEQVDDGTGRSATEQYVEGFRSFWQPWLEAGTDVYVLGDPPMNGMVRDKDCAILNPQSPVECAVDRGVAQPADPMLEAASTPSDGPGRLVPVDLSDRFCDADRCYAVVGGLPVYADRDHLNKQYALGLVPEITARAGLDR
ncbi:acyltransferase family protein [Cellulosimicrobium cellulans]|uniref:Acyltransferase n=1 Tax=Cellulosimicrobium cellulans TaxID=1710 RepID=A0A4Y4E263_CELCE|nr:acyltransferase family protein [Cellulosimicrobium cellulans]GED09638.1 acyltransferase [Cellulosimicrobium cellulans]